MGHLGGVSNFNEPSKRHGASLEITKRDGFICHNGARTAFRSYRDGARIGCTFITTEALEHIAKKHADFVNNTESKEHQ